MRRIDQKDVGVENMIREVIKMPGGLIVTSKLSGTLRLRIMRFTSRKIKWVGTQAFAETVKGRTQITSDVLAKNLSTVARKLVSGMVEATFPIRVVRRDGNMLVLNLSLINHRRCRRNEKSTIRAARGY